MKLDDDHTSTVHPVGTTGLECPNCHEMEGQQMTDIVKGMARAYHEAYWNWMPTLPRSMEDEAMRAALLWLADNVSDEMVAELVRTRENILGPHPLHVSQLCKLTLAAAIRAAAGGE